MARETNPYEQLAALVARAQTGDREAFEALYRRTAQAQYFSLAGKVGDEAAADLLQEVYGIVWQNIGKVRPRSFIGYLNSVSRNVCLRYFERGRYPHETSTPHEDLDTLNDSAGKPKAEHEKDPALVADRRDEHQRLAAALRTALDDREREIVLLRFYQDMRLNDIAEALDISESTVKRTLKRALEKLRDKLGFLPFGAAFGDLLQRAVEAPLAPGASPRRTPRRIRPLDVATKAVAALSVAAVIGCVGLAAAGHNEGRQPEVIEEAPVPTTERDTATPADTAAPELVSLRTEQGTSVLRLSDESGVADVRLIGPDGTAFRAQAIEDAPDTPGAVDYRFAVSSGTYAVEATDLVGNKATGEVTIDMPPAEPGPYEGNQ